MRILYHINLRQLIGKSYIDNCVITTTSRDRRRDDLVDMTQTEVTRYKCAAETRSSGHYFIKRFTKTIINNVKVAEGECRLHRSKEDKWSSRHGTEDGFSFRDQRLDGISIKLFLTAIRTPPSLHFELVYEYLSFINMLNPVKTSSKSWKSGWFK